MNISSDFNFKSLQPDEMAQLHGKGDAECIQEILTQRLQNIGAKTFEELQTSSPEEIVEELEKRIALVSSYDLRLGQLNPSTLHTRKLTTSDEIVAAFTGEISLYRQLLNEAAIKPATATALMNLLATAFKTKGWSEEEYLPILAEANQRGLTPSLYSLANHELLQETTTNVAIRIVVEENFATLAYSFDAQLNLASNRTGEILLIDDNGFQGIPAEWHFERSFDKKGTCTQATVQIKMEPVAQQKFVTERSRGTPSTTLTSPFLSPSISPIPRSSSLV